MGEMIGMDIGQVELLAGRLRTQGEGLSGIVASIDNLMYQFGSQWSGPMETEFVHSWQRTYRPALLRVQTDVLGLAQSAFNNVTSQEQASGSHGGMQGIWSLNGGSSARSQEDRAAILSQTKGMTASQEQAWWLSIGQAQRKEYLANAPGVLMGLPGLAAYMAVYKGTETASVDQQGEASLTVRTPLASFSEGANDQVMIVKNADGSATVEIGGGIYSEAQKQLGGAGSGLSVGARSELGGSRTYSFASAADAQAFYNQIMQGGHPTAIQLVGNIDRAAHDKNLNLISETISEKVTGAVAAQGGDGQVGGKANLSGSVEAVYDVKQRTETMNFTLSGSAAGNIGLDGARANGDLQVAVVSGQTGNQITAVQTVTVSGDYSTSTVHGSDLNNVSTGHGGTFSMEIASTPETTAQINALRDNLEGGDYSSASANLSGLIKDSTIVSQTDTMAGVEVGGSHGSGVQLTMESTTTATNVTSTSIKPPGYTQALPFP